MNISLIDKKAVVCGSTSGIGRATAVQLAALGAEVCLVSRSEDKLKGVLSELPVENGQRHSYMAIDFSRPETLREKLAEMPGLNGYHILVNNTGGPKGGSLIDAALSEFENTFRQHLICNHILVQALVPEMKTAGYGRIVNIISTSVKQPIPGLGVSNTIRGAVASWSKTLATELGPYGITVNNVLPGFTATKRLDAIVQNQAEKCGKTPAEIEEGMKAGVPARRFAQPEETAWAVAFLAGEATSYINGINLPVDGGRTGSL